MLAGGLATLSLAIAGVALPRPLPAWSLLALGSLGAAGGMATASLLRHRLSLVHQLAKFVVVGGLSAMIDLGLLNVLMYSTGWSEGVEFGLLKATSFSLGMTNAYLWNRNWTFRDRIDPGSSTRSQFLLYIAVALSGMLLNAIVATVIVSSVPAPLGWEPFQWANAAAVIAMGVSAMWDFNGYRVFVFRSVAPTAALGPSQSGARLGATEGS